MVSVHRSQRTGRVICATSLAIASAAEATGCPSAFDSSFAVGSDPRSLRPRPRRRSRRRRRHVVGVERACGGQRANPGLGGRILGQLVQRREAACGDDLTGGVAVGGHQIQLPRDAPAPRPRRRRARPTSRSAPARRPLPSRRRGWRPAARRRRRRSRRRSRRPRSHRPNGPPPPCRLRPAARACVSSWCASSVAATTSGCVTAVSVISSAVAVVPSRARSRPLISDHAARRSAAPVSSSHGGEHAGGLGALSGRKQVQARHLREHCESGFARCKRL